MTRQEALTVLRNTAWLGTDEHREAVEVAIEVLEETSQNLAKPFNADQHVQRVGNVGDVINRQDALDAIYDDIQMYDEELDIDGYDRAIDARRDGLIDAFNTVKFLPSAQVGTEMSVPNWIPCTERLPSEAGNYLIWYRFYDVIDDKVKSTCALKYYSVMLEHWLGLRYSEYSRDEVLAWMPLPAPWKGGEKE